MNVEEAKTLLSGAVKSELRDHAFGDCEVVWFTEAGQLASGYFGGSESSVSVQDGTYDDTGVPIYYTFKDADADTLRECFAAEKVDRNDETGPDDFVIGRIMPGLTVEGVRKELTSE